MKAASVLDLIKALADYHKRREFKIVETGLRPGEKIHECMDREINLTSENTPNRWTRSELLELISCVE
jgi:FlaA1/EpsC-like NDP-sugar epimerase